MAKKNTMEFEVSVFIDGIQEMSGDILSMSDGVMMFRYKKPASALYAVKSIAMDNVVGYSGAVGQPSTVMFKNRVRVKRIRHALIEPQKNGMILVTPVGAEAERMAPMIFKASAIEAVAEKDVEAPADGVAKKKAKKANGKKAEKKAEKK